MIINFTRSSGSSMLTALFMSVLKSLGTIFHIATCSVSNQILQKWNATRVYERKGHVVHTKQYKEYQKHRVMHAAFKLFYNITIQSTTVNTFDSVLKFKMLGTLNISNCALSLKSVGSWIEQIKN